MLARKINVVPLGKIFSLPRNKSIKAIRAYNLQIIAENKREKIKEKAYNAFFTAHDVAYVVPCKASWKTLLKAYKAFMPYMFCINTYYGYIKRYANMLKTEKPTDFADFIAICKKYDISIK